jgi:lipoprotein-anchoring transpeptidase ErfK/SrfK
MHAGRIPNPGSPASHGCVRLPYDMAVKIYAVAPTGSTVTIVQ